MAQESGTSSHLEPSFYSCGVGTGFGEAFWESISWRVQSFLVPSSAKMFWYPCAGGELSHKLLMSER